ncbi:MAG: ABC transporter permease subunit [Caldilineaceae bacterium]|nr:ABC transporter permease subunit [Caldilineaceae bacterium]
MSQTTHTGPNIATYRLRRATRAHLRDILGRDWETAYIFVLPTILLLGGLIAYPFLKALYLSFTNTISLETGPFVGLANYTSIWADRVFRQSVSNTVVYTLSSVFFKFWLGLLAAILLNRLKRFREILTALVLLPWIVPSIVIAITWRNLLDPIYGGVNQFLLQFGLIDKGFPWLGDYSTALPSVIMVNIWQGIPFFTIMMLAGLSSIDAELYEAARIDGASAWRLFLHVTLPGLRYVIIVATLLSTIWTFNGFTDVFLLTNGGPAGATRVYSILAFEYAVQAFRIGRGVAVAMTMAPFLGIIIFFLGQYMSPGGQIEEKSMAEKEGTGALLGTLISWPFRRVAQFFLALFWLVNNAVETLLESLVRGMRRTTSQSKRAYRPGRGTGIFAGVVLTLILLFELIPFYWVLITAFKTTVQYTTFTSVFWPEPWSLEQFKILFGPTRAFILWYQNTIVVALVSTVVSVVVASLGAYGLTRLRWRGANFFSSIVLIAYLMPPVLMFIPIYQIFSALHLTNNLVGLMIAYPTFSLPFATWLMMGYYASIPQELEEAALIDGCNHFEAWYRIVLPLAAPALMAASLFSITGAWKEFIFAYVFLSKERLLTLSVGLAKMIVGDILPWGQLMAAALLMAIPVVILYSVGQRFMVAGLTAGAVKG